MRVSAIFLLLILIFSVSLAGDIEERIKILEEKVKKLEERLNKLENKQKKSPVLSSSDISDIIVVKKDQNIIGYKVLSKKFNPLKLKETLWQRSDQIILKMEFKNNLNRGIKNISGKVIIYDKDGNELMSKKVNVNKALNFFKGMIIKPGEVVKMHIEFDYDPQNKKHQKVKDLPLSDLVVRFYPLNIEFEDGTVKYIKYGEE